MGTNSYWKCQLFLTCHCWGYLCIRVETTPPFCRRAELRCGLQASIDYSQLDLTRFKCSSERRSSHFGSKTTDRKHIALYEPVRLLVVVVVRRWVLQMQDDRYYENNDNNTDNAQCSGDFLFCLFRRYRNVITIIAVGLLVGWNWNRSFGRLPSAVRVEPNWNEPVRPEVCVYRNWEFFLCEFRIFWSVFYLLGDLFEME